MGSKDGDSRNDLVSTPGTRQNLSDDGAAAKPSTPLLPRQDRMTGRLALALFSAVWGSVEFGWNTGVINNPKQVIQIFINQSYEERTGQYFDTYTLENIWSWLVVSIFAIAGMIGGLLAGVLADKLGRKRGMLVNAVIGVLGGILMAISKPAGSYELIIVGRFLVGLCSGLYTGLVPLYLSETAPMSFRGAAGVLHQLGVVSGILVSQILGLKEVLGTTELWPVLMGLAAIPCFLQLLFLPFCPESPRYLLLTKGDIGSARKALVNLRGHGNVDGEVDAIFAEFERNSNEESVRLSQLFTKRVYTTPLVIGIVMHLSQQLSGIGVIFSYSNTVFIDAGLSEAASGYATLGVGAIMVIMTLVTVPLMDRAGRRPLHLIGLSGILICSVGFTIFFSLQPQVSWFAYPGVVLALSVVIFFALGPGSIPWMIMPELFAQEARSKAVSIGVAVNWTANFLVGALFPIMQNGLQRLLFLPFIGFTTLCLVFLYFKLPETKNKTIDEIVSIFAKSPNYGGFDNSHTNKVDQQSMQEVEEDKT